MLHIVAYTVIFFHCIFFSVVSQITTKVAWKCPIKANTTSKMSNTHQRVSLMPIYPRLKWLNFLLILLWKMIPWYICAVFEGTFSLVRNTFWACSVLCSLIPPHPFGVILSKKCDSVQSGLTLSISSYSALSLTSSSHLWHNILHLLSPKVVNPGNVCWVHILFTKFSLLNPDTSSCLGLRCNTIFTKPAGYR